LLKNGLAVAAEAPIREALRLKPAFPEAQNTLGSVLRVQGRAEEAAASFGRAADLDRRHRSAASNAVYALQFSDAATAEAILEEAIAFRRRMNVVPRTSWDSHDFSPERRLRIGFVSPDFRRHSVAYFASTIIASLDREAFEVHALSDVTHQDAMTAAIRADADRWHDIAGHDDDAVLKLIDREQLDVLVDLTGHTGGNRLAMFERRAAPVQLTWLGYPGTTGLTSVDYRLVDAITDPPGSEAHGTEALFRLAPIFLCYSPPEEAPPVAAPGNLERGTVMFGSFNNVAKVSPTTVALWAAILHRVPAARLLLKSRWFADPEMCSLMARRFHSHGIPAERLDLRPHAQSLTEHLAIYGSVDIGLDTFPYNGTTTTFEALWMGVPVFTWSGDRHAARVGASIMAASGEPDLVAEDPDDFVDRVTRAATAALANPASAAAARQDRRARMSAGPLTDRKGFASEFGRAVRTIWRERCAARTHTLSKPSQA
jgi:predicted O-linked N-acetylglucosamine transferase (SPINDLY family)